ncbi:GvpL/GvpF family gas vesicle protein [Metabacillus mangrovi]|nr:GvpL/GvpF family gas vesicle protein [Metabacillus mangrovi]
MNTDKGLYVFCITSGPDFSGRSIYFDGMDRELLVIPYNDLFLAAAEVPLLLRPSKENLLLHQKVITFLMEEREAVFPFSFGHIVQSVKQAESLLKRLYPELQHMLPSLRGRIEVGLKVIGKKEWLLQKLEQAVLPIQSPSYKERIKQGELAERFFLSLRNQFAESIHQKLHQAAEDSKQNGMLTETMLLNGSYLIKREQEGSFDELVAELYERFKDQADFIYTGPWPPYNFVQLHLKAEKSS